LAPASFASAIQIEGQGWFIFGGSNDLETSQKLVDIDAKWEEGPAVLHKRVIYQCVVKVT